MADEVKKKSTVGKAVQSKHPLQTIVTVFPDTKEGRKANAALEKAVSELKHVTLEQIPFDKLDFGDLTVLEKFYSAPVVVVDVTERQYEACLFYQLGLRESFGMKHNVVTCVDQESAYMAGRKSSLITQDQLLVSSTSNYGVSNSTKFRTLISCYMYLSWESRRML